MSASKRVKHCSSGNRQVRKGTVLPVFTTLLVALIPKCPFCILAYSSAITLCSGSKMYLHTPAWTSWISISLSVLTLLMILLNYRGKRTWLAASLVIFGSSLIMVSELYTGEISLYYYGASMLLMGVWVNASFVYIYRRFLQPLIQKCWTMIAFKSTPKH